MKIATAYLTLTLIMMACATALTTTQLLFCSKKDSPKFCQPINSVMFSFWGY